MAEEEKKEIMTPDGTCIDYNTKGVLKLCRLKRRPKSAVFDKHELEMTLYLKLLGEDWCEQLDCKDPKVMEKIIQRLQNIANSPDLPALIAKKLFQD